MGLERHGNAAVSFIKNEFSYDFFKKSVHDNIG